MQTYLIIGNLFALAAAVCLGISVVKKSKKSLIGWQISDAVFGMLVDITLSAYAALVICVICFIRNILSYRGKLTKNITVVLTILSVIIGAWANNLGLIGWCPILASASYTILVYTTKTAQQMRWALVSNLFLWFIHDWYVQAYPLAITDIVLSLWTLLQIAKNRT